MAYNNKSVSPLKISEASYNKQNRKMRKENPTMGSKLTSGTSPRRVSFACRFGNMQGDMKDKMIRQTILTTQEDVEAMKKTLERIEDKLYDR